MINQVVVVGRIVKKPEIIETEDEAKLCYITIATPRNFKNEEGIYETDFVDCVLWYALAENVVNWCNKGDLVGIRGRIQTTIDETNKKKKTEIIAEKVSFLSSKKDGELDE